MEQEIKTLVDFESSTVPGVEILSYIYQFDFESLIINNFPYIDDTGKEISGTKSVRMAFACGVCCYELIQYFVNNEINFHYSQENYELETGEKYYLIYIEFPIIN